MGFLDKAKGLLAKHDDKVDRAVGKAGDLVDKKTGGKYAEHVDRAQEMARKHTGQGDTTSGTPASGTPSGTASEPESPIATGAPAGASGTDSGLQPGSRPGDVAGQPTASQRVQPDEPPTDAPVTGGGAPPAEERPQGAGAGEGGSVSRDPDPGSASSESGEETLGGVQTSDSGETDPRQ